MDDAGANTLRADDIIRSVVNEKVAAMGRRKTYIADLGFVDDSQQGKQ